ncbi:MAG: response regulator [Magnetococcales bacterium]|nr:response regulator [Magnetococcales bacterium]
MKTLIVDDLFENRKLLRAILQPFGQCDMVANGREALDFFEMGLLDGDPFDLVLLDIMMPGMDGQEVLKRMRALEREHWVHGRRDSVIIMVTALGSPRQVTDAFFKGCCTDYVTKPVTRTVLLDKLREYGLIRGESPV